MLVLVRRARFSGPSGPTPWPASPQPYWAIDPHPPSGGGGRGGGGEGGYPPTQFSGLSHPGAPKWHETPLPGLAGQGQNDLDPAARRLDRWCQSKLAPSIKMLSGLPPSAKMRDLSISRRNPPLPFLHWQRNPRGGTPRHRRPAGSTLPDTAQPSPDTPREGGYPPPYPSARSIPHVESSLLPGGTSRPRLLIVASRWGR